MSTNFLEVFGGNANKIVDVIDALACKIGGVDIHAQGHVLAGKVWLILAASLIANINGVLPDPNCNAILIKGANKLRGAERAVRNGEVAVGKALRHDDVEHWLLKRVPVPVCVVNATRNLEGLAAVNLGLIDATNAVKNLRRAGLSGQRNACVRSGAGVVELDVSDNVGVCTLLPRAVNAVGDVAPTVELVSDMLVVWIPCVEKIAHWPNAIVSAKNWTKVNLDGSDGGIDIKTKSSVGDEGRNTRFAQNAWVSSSARTVRCSPVDWTIGHTCLVRDGDAADDSGLVLIDGHLERLWSGVCGELVLDEVGTKTNVVGIVFLVCPVRSCIDKSVCGKTLWLKTVNYGNRKSRRSVCGGTVDVWSVIPNGHSEVLNGDVKG